MHRGRIALGTLGLIQERHIGLRDLGVDILQPDIHRANRNGQVFELGEEVEQVVWSESEFGRLDVLGGELECPEGQGRCQSQGGREGGAGRGRGGGRLWGYSILGLAAKLEGVCKSLFMCTDKAGQVLMGHSCQQSFVPLIIPASQQFRPKLTLMKSCPSSVLSFSMVMEEESS